jgi:peptidoglycan LD-endopeptidase CwlK
MKEEVLYNFGRKSLDALETCHSDIQMILNELIKFYDFSVLEGLRTTDRQQELFKEGRSKLDGINKLSKHQSTDGISMAVDIMPYKKGTNAFSNNEKDNRRFYTMMGMVKAISVKLLEEGLTTHIVRFGLDWDGDDTYTDQKFDDLPHLELILP